MRGKIIEIFERQAGVSKSNKEWVKQDFLIETLDKYPKKVMFSMFGDKTDMLWKRAVGDVVDVSFEVESREYNGKWYHNINAQTIFLVNEEKKAAEANTTPKKDYDKAAYGDLPPSESQTHAEQYKRAVDVDTIPEDEDLGLPF